MRREDKVLLIKLLKTLQQETNERIDELTKSDIVIDGSMIMSLSGKHVDEYKRLIKIQKDVNFLIDDLGAKEISASEMLKNRKKYLS